MLRVSVIMVGELRYYDIIVLLVLVGFWCRRLSYIIAVMDIAQLSCQLLPFVIETLLDSAHFLYQCS